MQSESGEKDYKQVLCDIKHQVDSYNKRKENNQRQQDYTMNALFYAIINSVEVANIDNYLNKHYDRYTLRNIIIIHLKESFTTVPVKAAITLIKKLDSMYNLTRHYGFTKENAENSILYHAAINYQSLSIKKIMQLELHNNESIKQIAHAVEENYLKKENRTEVTEKYNTVINTLNSEYKNSNKNCAIQALIVSGVFAAISCAILVKADITQPITILILTITLITTFILAIAGILSIISANRGLKEAREIEKNVIEGPVDEKISDKKQGGKNIDNMQKEDKYSSKEVDGDTKYHFTLEKDNQTSAVNSKISDVQATPKQLNITK